MANDAAARIQELAEILNWLTPEEKAEVDQILLEDLPIWTPIPGPQTLAYDSEADELLFGGSGGGSKTDMLIGLALTRHKRSIIFRRESTQLQGIVDRMAEVLRTRDGLNEQKGVWRLKGRQVEFGHAQLLGDEHKYMGRPHDLKAFDQVEHFSELQYRFLIGWNRTSVIGQRCRVVSSANPPTTQEGRWIISYWAPWLDDKHPNPAKPGELRWFTTIDGKDVELENGEPFRRGLEVIRPRSRTFIPSSVFDNPFLLATGYDSVLQALPEPLRSQMLLGDFKAGFMDDAWQVIPTAWVDAAMARWTEDGKKGPMDSVGADIARGGLDRTSIATRHAAWYSPIKIYPGKDTPDGASSAGLIIKETRDGAPIHVDVIGVGGSTYDHLKSNGLFAIAVNSSAKPTEGATDKATKQLRFRNYRAQIWWQFRESLDPLTGDQVALPPDPELKADLCAVTWKLTTTGILMEDKDEIRKKLGRSPDKGEAVIYCSINTPRPVKKPKRTVTQMMSQMRL